MQSPPPPPPFATSASNPPPQSQAPNEKTTISREAVAEIADKVAEKYVDKLKIERANFDQRQLGEIRTSIKDLLSDWSSKLHDAMEQQQQQLAQLRSQKTVDQTTASSSMDVVVGDIRERQAKMVQAIQDAHHRQIEILKAAIADERKESAQAQMIFEQTLKTRYENLVQQLHSKVQAESEARIQRSLDSLETAARAESDRARASSEVLLKAEAQLAAKFKAVVGDLRRSWEVTLSHRTTRNQPR
eukprot:gene35060-47112_t